MQVKYLLKQKILIVDAHRAVEIRNKRGAANDHCCTMCGKFCANDMLQGMSEKHIKGTDKG